MQRCWQNVAALLCVVFHFALVHGVHVHCRDMQCCWQNGAAWLHVSLCLLHGERTLTVPTMQHQHHTHAAQSHITVLQQLVTGTAVLTLTVLSQPHCDQLLQKRNGQMQPIQPPPRQLFSEQCCCHNIAMFGFGNPKLSKGDNQISHRKTQICAKAMSALLHSEIEEGVT